MEDQVVLVVLAVRPFLVVQEVHPSAVVQEVPEALVAFLPLLVEGL